MPENRKPITEAEANEVLTALKAAHPYDAEEFVLVEDFDGRDWTIMNEGGPEDWPSNAPGTATVWTEAINHYSIALYRK